MGKETIGNSKTECRYKVQAAIFQGMYAMFHQSDNDVYQPASLFKALDNESGNVS